MPLAERGQRFMVSVPGCGPANMKRHRARSTGPSLGSQTALQILLWQILLPCRFYSDFSPLWQRWFPERSTHHTRTETGHSEP